MFLYILMLCTIYIWKKCDGNYTLYEITAFDTYERSTLYSLHTKNKMVVFLNEITNEAAIPMNTIVDKCCTEKFETQLQDKGIEYININSNTILNEINSFKEYQPYAQFQNISDTFIDWESYTLWVDMAVKRNSKLKKISIAKTYEKRELFILSLSTGTRNSAVFILGGEEGRDWISPGIILNFLNNIIDNKNNLDVLTDLYDFYFLPFFNPDGYVYSMTKDKYWKKNRKDFFPIKLCPQNEKAIGVNIDRNWYFAKSSYARDAECDSVYIGHQALTEEEPKALSNFLNSIALHLMAFINLRGFGQLITVPFGYRTEYSNNYDILMEILTSACEKVYQTHNVSFNFGSTADYLYNTTGNSADWVKKMLNVPIVYTVYMGHKDYPQPRAEHIPLLTLQFTTIIKETLQLAQTIYTPLFNKQTVFYINYINIVIVIFLLIIKQL